MEIVSLNEVAGLKPQSVILARGCRAKNSDLSTRTVPTRESSCDTLAKQNLTERSYRWWYTPHWTATGDINCHFHHSQLSPVWAHIEASLDARDPDSYPRRHLTEQKK